MTHRVPAGPSQEEIRRYNLSALLRAVHARGPTSRAQLTAILGLNRSTIGALTTELVAAGLVTEETPNDRGRAGRPSLVVRPASGLVAVLAFAVEVDRVTAARIGLGGRVLDRRAAPRRPGDVPVAETAGQLATLAAELCRAAPPRTRYAGSGAAVTTLVRQHDGRVRLGGYGVWGDEPLAIVLAVSPPPGYRAPSGDGPTEGGPTEGAPAGGVPGPLAVGDLAGLVALAEQTRGVAVGCRDLVYLHGDGGIGSGIIAAGRLVTGHDGYGGQVAHMVVNPAGRLCDCGSRGCWETEVGEYALLAAAGPVGDLGVAAVLDAAGRGDTTAQAAVRQVGDWLGFGLANLVNIFNPEMVVFGGTLREIFLAAAPQVLSRLNRNALPACRRRVRLRTAVLGADAPLLGAAELAFEPLLGDPLEIAAGWPA